MSSLSVSDRHIDYLISAGFVLSGSDKFSWHVRPGVVRELDRHNFDQVLADQVGQMLENEIRVIMNHHLVQDGRTMLPARETPYTFRSYPGPIDPVQVIKAVACYEAYASNLLVVEPRKPRPEWETSEAAAFCGNLKHVAITHLPGYEDAYWQMPAPEEVPAPPAPSRAAIAEAQAHLAGLAERDPKFFHGIARQCWGRLFPLISIEEHQRKIAIEQKQTPSTEDQGPWQKLIKAVWRW